MNFETLFIVIKTAKKLHDNSGSKCSISHWIRAEASPSSVALIAAVADTSSLHVHRIACPRHPRRGIALDSLMDRAEDFNTSADLRDAYYALFNGTQRSLKRQDVDTMIASVLKDLTEILP